MIKESLHIVDRVEERIRRAPDDISRNVGHVIARSLTNKTDELKDPTLKDRMMSSALGALSVMAATPVISKLILRNKKISVPLLLANAAGAAATGYLSPDISNVIKREVRKEVSPSKAKKLIREIDSPSIKAFEETKEISELYGKGFRKESAFVGKTISLLGRGAVKTPGLLWKGTFPGAGAGFGRKALSYGMRGGLIAGAGYGGYKGVKRLSGPRSGSNYTTFLRNQLLAGRVHPSELSQQDLIAVRKLGMR